MVEITRKIEFDAGHRIPDHGSKCRNIHGHRYVLEVTADGAVIDNPGAPDHGMVIDFSELKTVMNDVVGDVWDHALLLWTEDPLNYGNFHECLHEVSNGTHKTVLLPDVPTVENLAIIALENIKEALQKRASPLKISRVRLYETPNCWADATDKAVATTSYTEGVQHPLAELEERARLGG